MRIAQLVKQGEVVINMFAGVGCFSIIIAKHSEASKIFSIDLNPKAVELMRENIILNRVEGRVEAILGDAWKVIETKFRGKADRVLMPLPSKAFEYLDIALLALRSRGGMIHYYDFIHVKKGENPENRMIEKIKEKMAHLHIRFKVVSSRIVRAVGPNWFQVVLDLKVE
jgi:tRNA (guanine37-N1)-methyltransferase